MKTFFFAILALVISPFFLGQVVLAQSELPCGNIITPANFYYEGSEEFSDPIQDCSNPFGRTGDLTNFTVNNQTVVNNATYTINASGTSNYGFRNENYFDSTGADYYKHSGNDFIRVNAEFTFPTTQAFVDEIPGFFGANQQQINFYRDAYLAEDKTDYFYVNGDYNVDRLDPFSTDGTKVYSVYYDMEQYLQTKVKSKRNDLLPGTYTVTLIDTDEGPNPTFEQNLIKKIFAQLIPTVHAYYYVNTVTFTLAEPTPEPTGASSVLFLPGIQASRLYLGDGNQVFNKIWEPSNNTDVSALGLTENGDSLVDIRTNDIIDEKSVQYIGGNIYKGFMSFMDELVDNNVIEEWQPFAYDWRYDAFDIVENGTKYLDGTIRKPTDEIIRLASSSLSKKVTIIAHSNGGLLAKAITSELESMGKGDLIDKIIFIGTPQLGTPKAIATILHGYDQEAVGGLIIDDGVARNVIKNLPGVYSLLPSEKYQELVSTPLIRFENTITPTNPLSGYGSTIDSLGEYNAFMNGQEDSSGRGSVLQSEVNKPTKVNIGMFFDAQLSHKQKLDNWAPPTTTKVFQIVGTGLATLESIEYREISETICPLNAVSVLLCPKVQILKPHANFTAYGDETVVSKSAEFVSGGLAEIAYLDLGSAQVGIFNPYRSHADLTESMQVQDFINNIITTSSSSNINFISNIEPVSKRTYEIQEINSPVQISATDSEGRVTGMVKENDLFVRKDEIPDSDYIEFGTTKYLILPSDITSTTTLLGEAWGGYTLTLSTLNSGNVQVKKHEIINATTTPALKATFTKSQATGYGVINTDLNGDNIIDSLSTVDGVTVPIVPNYSYVLLMNEISALQIQKVPKDILLALAKKAQSYHDKTTNKPLNLKLEKLTLVVLQTTINLYQRNKIITKVAADNMLLIINFLSK